jgi:HEAT repeat protein
MPFVTPTRRVLPLLSTAALAATLLLGCSSGPKPGEEAVFWGDQLVNAREYGKKDVAMKHLAQLKDPRSLPSLYQALELPITDLKPQMVEVIGLIGDEGSVEPLLSAIDPAAGAGRDKETRIKANTNEKAIKALSRLSQKHPSIKEHPKVITAITRLSNSNSLDVQLAAVVALGDLQVKDAVDDLVLVADGHPNNFMVKNAAEALMKIGDARSAEVMGKLLFFERDGVSFYREASFALFLLGKDALPTLKAIYDGKFKPIEQLHVEPNVQKTKAIVVYGDLADPSTFDLIVRHSDEQGNDTSTALLRIESQRAAGRIGLDKAVPGLKNRMDNVDISQSEHALAALTQMGRKEIVGALWDLTSSAGFMKNCQSQGGSEDRCKFSEKQVRKPRLLAYTRLAPGTDLATFEAAIASEGNASVKEEMEKMKPRLEAARDCDGKGVGCWKEKLKADNAMVRDRAAYELLWINTDESRDALIEALTDKDNEVRYAAIMGVLRRLPKDAEAVADRLKAQLDSERGQAQYIRINEDLKRLEVRVRRGY